MPRRSQPAVGAFLSFCLYVFLGVNVLYDVPPVDGRRLCRFSDLQAGSAFEAPRSTRANARALNPENRHRGKPIHSSVVLDDTAGECRRHSPVTNFELSRV
jgi:hypothetical protein